MQEISKEQMKMTVKLKFNDGGSCEGCFFCVNPCRDIECTMDTRIDKKNGNWILDDGK